MKKLTQKLVLSVVTMALVVIALGTSTFAWFTLTNSARVGSFEAQVTAGTGIEISLGQLSGQVQSVDYDTETSWFTAMPTSVIQTFINTKYPNFQFDNVTSPTGTTFFEVDGSTSAAAGTYIQFTLFFRSREASMPIALDYASLAGESDTWTVNSPVFKHTDGNYYGLGALPSWELGSPSVYTSMPVAAWPAARLSVTGSSTIVFQAAAVAGSNTVVANSTALPSLSYDIEETASGSEVWVVGNDAFGAAAYEKANTFLRQWNGATAPTITIPAAVTSAQPTTTIMTLSAATQGTSEYYGGSITVRVWIEGWDADTYDAIFSQTLAVALGFAKTTA